MTREVLPLLSPVDVEELRRDEQKRAELAAQPLHPRETYLSLSKGFGSVPSDELMELALKLEASDYPFDVEASGSAMIEATLFSPYRTDETADDDVYMVEYGIVLLQEAAEKRWEDLERGFLHPDDQTKALRAEIRAAFGPIYLDLLKGDITAKAREQTYSQLAYWGDYILKLGNHYGSFGLAYEVATLMGGLTDESVVLPGTPRADSGTYKSNTTHDFTHITVDENGFIKSSMPLELKNEGDENRQLDNARRYDQHHVVVMDANKDLALHRDDLHDIFSQRSINPTARRNLVSIRNGIYNCVSEAERKFGAEA